MTVIPDPTLLQVERLDFLTADGITLTGSLFHDAEPGDAVVLLGHMGGRDQRDWQVFARLLAGKGLPAFALDFRCHGESGCDASMPEAHLADLRAAFDLLRERGYRHIACVGASLGARACISAALYEEMAGLAFLAGPDPGIVEGRQYPQDLISPDMPKLFVVTEYDPYAVARTAVPNLYEISPEPRDLRTFPGTAHGTELFSTEYGEELCDLLVNFLLEAMR
jgi:pimeloyl-ACP methyl ester carboxylesterase